MVSTRLRASGQCFVALLEPWRFHHNGHAETGTVAVEQSSEKQLGNARKVLDTTTLKPLSEIAGRRAGRKAEFGKGRLRSGRQLKFPFPFAPRAVDSARGFTRYSGIGVEEAALHITLTVISQGHDDIAVERVRRVAAAMYRIQPRDECAPVGFNECGAPGQLLRACNPAS